MQAGQDKRTAPEHERTTISGREARQGEIVLRTRPRRIAFIAGLVGIVVLAFLLALAGRW